MFDAGQLRATTFIRHVEVHDTLGSTNDRAAELACRTDVELPALVVSRHQTAGKGRGKNTWWSADGALTFSVLIDPATTGVVPASWPQLSLAAAVAICDALRHELDRHPPSTILRAGSSPTPANPQSAIRSPQSQLGIKWPNDVFLEGGKVCGILIESPGGSAPAKDRLLIGIGINVNNSWRNAPQEAGSRGTALCDVTGRSHELRTVLSSVLDALQARIAQLRAHDIELIHDWQRLNLLAGHAVLVECDGRRIEGTCLEIAPYGALVVDTKAGQQRLYSGSVRDSAAFKPS